jgi:hypothetical protein
MVCVLSGVEFRRLAGEAFQEFCIRHTFMVDAVLNKGVLL